MFDAARYEGSDADERRLFYVAITRARDMALISRHEKVTTKRVRPSPYFEELVAERADPDTISVPAIEPRRANEELPVQLTFSELAQFLSCGMEYRLRGLLGFQPRLAPELGYGKAVHHMLRAIADHTRERGKAPTADEVDAILDDRFFLPTANKVAHREMKDAARRLITEYVTAYESDLHRVWESERPFELRLNGVTISGRADVILDYEGDVPTALAILDYKTSTRGEGHHDLQLQVYANAGRREGLDVRGAYVHDLKRARRDAVDVSGATITSSEHHLSVVASQVRRREFEPSPGPKCRGCEVRTVCGSGSD